MPDSTDEHQIGKLIEAAHKLAITTEYATKTLEKLEALFIDMIRKQDEDRIENKERQKKADEETEEFKKRQQKWDERDKKWEEQRGQNNPWLRPEDLSLFLFAVAFAAIAITASILANR